MVRTRCGDSGNGTNSSAAPSCMPSLAANGSAAPCDDLEPQLVRAVEDAEALLPAASSLLPTRPRRSVGTRIVGNRSDSLLALLGTEEALQAVPQCWGHAHHWDASQLPLSPREQLCEHHLGLTVVNRYLNNTKDWCGDSGDDTNSWLRCSHASFPWGKQGLLCEAHNLTMDLGKIEAHDRDLQPKTGTPHFVFSKGATGMRCGKTAHWSDGLLMPHMKRQLGAQAGPTLDPTFSPPAGHTRIGETTYLMPRDLDADNIFHMSADFMNMEVAYRALGLDANFVQVLIWDKLPLYSYTQMLARAFGGGRPVLNRKSLAKLGHGVLTFHHLVFHLESPAANVHERVTLNLKEKEPMRCRGSSLWRAYTRRVLCAYSLWPLPPPSVPHLTLSIRKRTPQKNVGRILANQNELEDVMREGNMLTWQTVNLAEMSFEQQLTAMRRTNVYIGVHGAGLMLIMFTADESVLLGTRPVRSHPPRASGAFPPFPALGACASAPCACVCTCRSAPPSAPRICAVESMQKAGRGRRRGGGEEKAGRGGEKGRRGGWASQLLTLAVRNRNTSELSARPALPECGAAKRPDLHAHAAERGPHVCAQSPCSNANTPTRHASKLNAHQRVAHAADTPDTTKQTHA